MKQPMCLPSLILLEPAIPVTYILQIWLGYLVGTLGHIFSDRWDQWFGCGKSLKVISDT